MEQKENKQEENKQINASLITSTICDNNIFWLKLLKAHYASLRIYFVKPEKAESAFIRFEKGILKILEVKIIALFKCHRSSSNEQECFFIYLMKVNRMICHFFFLDSVRMFLLNWSYCFTNLMIIQFHQYHDI